MRAAFVLVHRYAGLAIAAFLFVSGLTGAIISWDHELDDLLNPQLMEAPGRGARADPLELARRIESRHPQVHVTFVPLDPEEGKSAVFGVEPRLNPATGRLFEPGYNEVFVDPASGAELGKREWGGVWPVTRENLVSFLYVLHYSLHIPEMWGTDRWGLWLLGILAIVWTLDCFVGFYLTLPLQRRGKLQPAAADATTKQFVDDVASSASRTWWQRWRPAWAVRWRGGATKLNFDLHRAFSLWTWALLLLLAFTGFSLNLYNEVFYPLMSRVSQVTPSPFDVREPRALHDPIMPRVSYAAVIESAKAEARQRNLSVPAGSVFYAQLYGIYGVSFFERGGDHGAAGVGPPVLYYDGVDGSLLGDRQPWKGTAADVFVQAQFPLHSGRILGLPGRILISLMGLIVAMLSMTGVVIWWKKRAARVRQVSRAIPERPASEIVPSS